MRATPPSLRISDGTRSSAITARRAGLFRDHGLLGVGDVHDDAALQHLRQARPSGETARRKLKHTLSSHFQTGWRGAGSTPSPAPARSSATPLPARPQKFDPKSRGPAGSAPASSPAKLNRNAPGIRPRHREIPAGQIGDAFLLRARQQARRIQRLRQPHPHIHAALRAACSACPPADTRRTHPAWPPAARAPAVQHALRDAPPGVPIRRTRSSTACES